MGLFNRSQGASARATSQLQIPDELAQRARIEYGNSRFAAAAELYSDAVDKLHTMYVIGQCTYRQPSEADTAITEGLTAAVGAALAVDPSVHIRGRIESSAGYLGEILGMPQARQASGIYERAIAELSRLYRTASN